MAYRIQRLPVRKPLRFSDSPFTPAGQSVRLGVQPLSGLMNKYRGADKSLARPERKQATATEDFDVHISYL
jgi:hypothetical protein